MLLKQRLGVPELLLELLVLQEENVLLENLVARDQEVVLKDLMALGLHQLVHVVVHLLVLQLGLEGDLFLLFLLFLVECAVFVSPWVKSLVESQFQVLLCCILMKAFGDTSCYLKSTFNCFY